MSFCVILGLPMMLLLHVSLNFETSTLHCPVINESLPLHMQQLDVSIPSESQLDNDSFAMTTTFRSNIINTHFVIHHVLHTIELLIWIFFVSFCDSSKEVQRLKYDFY